MEGITLFGYTIVKSKVEREFQKLFQHYENTLLAQKQKMCDDITEWADALMQSIYKNLNRQKFDLDRAYSERVRYLTETYNQFIEDLRVREQINDTEQINQLLKQYKVLKYQLAELETTVQTIPFIQVPQEKKSVIENQDRSNGIKTRNAVFDNASIVEDDDELENSMNTYSTLSSSPSFTNTTQTDRQSLQLNSDYGDNRSMNGDEDHARADVKDDNFLKKCPVCFMIFPLTMSAFDRSRHIDEHYNDD